MKTFASLFLISAAMATAARFLLPRNAPSSITFGESCDSNRADFDARLARSFATPQLFRQTWRLLNHPQRSVFLAILLGLAGADMPSLAFAGESQIDRGASDVKRVTPQVGEAVPDQTTTKTPTLVVNAVEPKRAGTEIPLDISVHDLNAGAFAVISGCSNGTTLSAGTSLSEGSWWLPTAELEHVIIRPPQHFAGTMDLTIELRLADTKLLDKKSLHLEWLAPPALDADQMSALLKRGDDLIASGDLAAAQLVLRRAAESGSARAAMTLAGTYDPVVLAKLGVHGFSPDIVLARQWYEKAKQLGSIEAARRLEMLAIKRD